MITIAFSGKKDSGKDTSANFLSAQYLQRFNPRLKPVVLGLSYPLKEFCSSWLNLSRTKLHGTEDDKNEKTHLLWDTLPEEIRKSRTGLMTYREVLQIWGTDIFRRVSPTIHVDRWRKEAQRLEERGCPLLLVTDVRFPDEVEYLRSRPTTRVIRLTRNPHPDDNHSTEKALDDYPWGQELHGTPTVLLDNDGPLDTYKARLLEWFLNTQAGLHL